MHREQAVGDLDGRVLVDTDAEQPGGAGDDGHEPTVARPLGEVLVDDDTFEQTQALADAAAALQGDGTVGARAIMNSLMIEAPADVPPITAPRAWAR